APGNLKNIVTDDDEEENNAADAPKWSFYYITMISKEKISCSDPSLSSHSCSLIPQQPTTQISAADLDPQLEDGDFHVWSSTTLLSYTQGVLSPSLQDMGFQNKWNLTSFEQATINTVEALSTDSEATYELMPIEIELDDLVPRYNVSASVENNWTDPSCSDSSDGTCPKNQLGLRPLSWIVEDPLVSDLTQRTHRRIYYNGLHSSTLTENLELYVWGIPDEDHFENFPAVDSTSTYYTPFQQWGSFPDVSVEALMVFETTYNSETETEAWFDENSEQRGALCRDSERVVFVYYDSADRPSEALWYQLSGIKPGWKVSYGTQGQIDTWRFMVEATTGVLTYNNLEVSSTCTVPSDWN
ncbi:MAG: hypothetical protein VX278_11165, partial [Myxococcota bacterium]|nr:hypothetical protein [Myxococcota bacterium]